MSNKLFSIIVALTLAVTAQAQAFVTDGLIVMYTLDKADIDGDTVKDVSGNDHDAKIMGILKSVKGVIGECLEFDGGQNYVEIPKFGAMEQASVECWTLTSKLGATHQGIVSTWQWTAGKVHFKFQTDRTLTVHKNDGVKIGQGLIAEENTWYHVIYTCDTKANELKLYVNGEFIEQGASGSTPQNMDERRIGSEHDGRFLTGMVDEVRIYNRVLSPEEAEQNFNVKSNLMTVELSGKLTTTWAGIKTRY